MPRSSSSSPLDKVLDQLTKSDPGLLASAGVIAAVATIQVGTDWNPLGRCASFLKQLRRHEKNLTCSDDVASGYDGYAELHAAKDAETRNTNYKKLVNSYYDLATVFYEWGWGASFHFHYRFPFEKFAEATRRHEYQLAACLNVTRKARILDVGCGIGGPLRNIARFLGCRATGLTLNPYQVERGNELCRQDPTVAGTTEVVQGDFMDLPFEPSSFQGAYAIEATCHAPDRTKCYKQVYDVLEPGAHFALYEWCMTDKYDPNDPEHQRLKKDIEAGNGLPDVATTKECLKSMEEAGFEIIDAYDFADGYEAKGQAYPWYHPLTASWNPLTQRFQFNWLGGHLTNIAIFMLEFLWLAPKGTVKTQKVLQAGGFALRDAGKEGIFTTAYLMIGRKPLLIKK